MKITELSIPNDKSSAESILYNAGYESLGSGSFGSVYKKPGADYVLKLFQSDDKGYLLYLSTIKQHQNNPHFPKIKGKLIKINENYYAVRMEELSETNILNRTLELLNQFCKRRSSFWLGNMDAFMKSNFRASDREEIEDLFQKYPQLLDALTVIAELKSQHDLWFDFKRANIMDRSGIMVFTDPVV